MIQPLPRTGSNPIRIVIAATCLAGIAAYIYGNRSELQSLTNALRTGRWSWLLVGITYQALYYFDEAWYFSRAFCLTGTLIAAPSIVPVLLGAQTLSVVVPTEFLADQSLFFLFAKRHEQSPAKVALGVSLAEIAELFALMPVLLAGFLFLALYRTVQPLEAAAGYVVSLVCVLLAAVVAFLLWKPQAIAQSLDAAQRLWNSFCRIAARRWRLSPNWSQTVARRLMEGVTVARHDPRGVTSMLLLALGGHFIRIACLFAVVQAFGLPMAAWKVVTAYAIGTLAWVASPIPGGIGLVEGAYSLVFVSLGTLPAAAATLALVYRGVIFWLPLGAGVAALRFLSWRKPAHSVRL